MKSPALSKFKVDPFVFAVYTSIGIFFVSVPLIIYLLAIKEFEFELWSILGAVDIVIIGMPSRSCLLQMLHFCFKEVVSNALEVVMSATYTQRSTYTFLTASHYSKRLLVIHGRTVIGVL